RPLLPPHVAGHLHLQLEESSNPILLALANCPTLALEALGALDLDPLAVLLENRESGATEVLNLVASGLRKLRESKRHRTDSDLINERVDQNWASEIWAFDRVVSGDLNFFRPLKSQRIETAV